MTRRLRWAHTIFSPLDFLASAALLSLVFLACHLAGFREFASILCGTLPSTGPMAETMALLGVFYAMVYMVFIVLVPILVLGAGIVFLFSKLPKVTR